MSTSKSAIEWTDSTWNPVRGCALVSPGCTNCYAMKQAHRFSGVKGQPQPYFGLTRLRSMGGPVWTGEARFIPEKLAVPLRWKRPRKVFVNSMSDLFHEDVSNEQIAAVFGVMAACPQHTFQVLTKRAERMLEWFEWAETARCRSGAPLGPNQKCRDEAAWALTVDEVFPDRLLDGVGTWPLPNVWLGVSVESQRYADERLPLLLRAPAAVRFVSAEPLVEGVDLSKYLEPLELPGIPEGLDWVIVGGESGPAARPFCLSWAMNIVADCEEWGVPVFVKQLGARPYTPLEEADDIDVFHEHDVDRWLEFKDRKGGDWNEWDPYLHKRQFPKEAR